MNQNPLEKSNTEKGPETGPITFCIRFPFKIENDDTIKENLSDFEIAGHLGRLLKGVGRWYSIILDGFSTEDDARRFVPMLQRGLEWLALSFGFVFSYADRESVVAWSEDPTAAAKNLSFCFGGAPMPECVHGIADDDRVTIYRSDQTIKYLGGGDAIVSIGYGPKRIVNALQHAFTLPGIRANEAGIQTAFELYRMSLIERGQRAKFLTLMSALECLASRTTRPKPMIEFLVSTEVSLHEHLRLNPQEDDEAWERLNSGIQSLKTESATSALRRTFYDIHTKTRLSSAEIDAMWSVIKDLYGVRSKLSHSGALQEDLNLAVDKLGPIVKKTLIALYATEDAVTPDSASPMASGTI